MERRWPTARQRYDEVWSGGGGPAYMHLKKNYSSREVASITGLSARQLQWWDARKLMKPSISPRRTEAGGFTERRYSPVDLFELAVLADLRQNGLSVSKLRLLLDTLRRRFGVRLFDAIGGGGAITLLTDGKEIYARTDSGQFFNMLRAPSQPLLVVGEESTLRELKLRMRSRRVRRKEKGKRKKE
jgi:DNA-binding transcriptional MerR regulator